MRHLIHLILRPIILLVTLTGCQTSQSPPVLLTETSIPTQTATATVTSTSTATLTPTMTLTPSMTPTDVWAGDPVPEWATQEIESIQAEGIEVDLDGALWSEFWQGYVRLSSKGEVGEWLDFSDKKWITIAQVIHHDGLSVMFGTNYDPEDLVFIADRSEQERWILNPTVDDIPAFTSLLSAINASTTSKTIVPVDIKTTGYYAFREVSPDHPDFEHKTGNINKRIFIFSNGPNSADSEQFYPNLGGRRVSQLLFRAGWFNVIDAIGASEKDSGLNIISAAQVDVQGDSTTGDNPIITRILLIVFSPAVESADPSFWFTNIVFLTRYAFDSNGLPITEIEYMSNYTRYTNFLGPYGNMPRIGFFGTDY